MQTISVETLRSWLDERRPVSVLDVRPTSERREWAIPGSLHIDAYEALKAHDPAALSALASLNLPSDHPVVAVCGAGKTSLVAAEQLAARGFEAYSLEGGMRAWSLAWNTAEVPLSGVDAAVRVIQVRRTGKGCLSYLIGVGAEAFVIDASLESQVYLALAAQRGWRITRVFDTHIHADHLSRARELAERCGAELALPDQRRVSFPFAPVREGDCFTCGQLQLTALHTPGHTEESTCYLLNKHVLFTGDTLFLTGVGRPDLAADQQEATARAGALHESLHRLLALPASTVVLPGHTSVPIPFDGVSVVARLAEIERRVDMLHVAREDFVRELLTRLPAPPPNYERIVRLNERGTAPQVPVTELEAGANRCAVS